MLELPMWVHESWRPTFEHRWHRARPRLVLSLVVTPVVVAAVGLAALAAYTGMKIPPAVLVLALVLLVAPIAYPCWFLFAGRIASNRDFWGTRVGWVGFAQSGGVSIALQAAPDDFGNGITLGVPAALFGLAVLGGVVGWRAHAILLDDIGDALAATSTVIEEPLSAAIEPIGYPGEALVDSSRLTWTLYWHRPGWPSITMFRDTVALNEILDMRVVPLGDPMSVPPLGFLSDGRPIRPYPGELLVLRTPYREVGIPAMGPRRLYRQLTVRLTAMRSSAAGSQR